MLPVLRFSNARTAAWGQVVASIHTMPRDQKRAAKVRQKVMTTGFAHLALIFLIYGLEGYFKHLSSLKEKNQNVSVVHTITKVITKMCTVRRFEFSTFF